MMRSLLVCLSAIVLVTLTGCSSTTPSDPNNPDPNVAVGTIQVKLDGTLKSYTILSCIWSTPNNSLVIHAKDPDVATGDIRIFIYAPKAGEFPVQKEDKAGMAEIQLISFVNGNATGTIATSGSVNVSSLTDSNVKGTFTFDSSISGDGTTSVVKGTEGVFNLNVMKN